MRFILIIFILLTIPKGYGQEVKSIEAIVHDVAICHKKSGCIDENIIKNTDNIADLVKVVQILDHNLLSSKDKFYLYYWEHLKLSPAMKDDDHHFLRYEYLILSSLSDCLSLSFDKTSKDFLSELQDKIDFHSRDFYYGKKRMSVGYEIMSSIYSCLLLDKSDENNRLSKCREKALNDYLFVSIPKQIKHFKEIYPLSISDADKEHASFLDCTEKSKNNFDCLEILNTNLLKLRKSMLLTELASVDIISKKELADLLKKCDGGKTICNDDLIQILSKNTEVKLKNKSSFDTKSHLLNKVVVRCNNTTGLHAQRDCFDSIALTFANPSNLPVKDYYQELKTIEKDWHYNNFNYIKDSPWIISSLNMTTSFKDMARTYPGLSFSELTCLKSYTGGAYKNMNENLWESGARLYNTSEAVTNTGCVISALKKISKTYLDDDKLYKERVFRGVGYGAPYLDRFHENGECVVFTGATSTSYEEEGAFEKPYMLEIINCPKGDSSTGGTIDGISGYTKEKEVLFPPGVRFKVVKKASGKKKSRRTKKVVLECITEDQAKADQLNCY